MLQWITLETVPKLTSCLAWRPIIWSDVFLCRSKRHIYQFVGYVTNFCLSTSSRTAASDRWMNEDAALVEWQCPVQCAVLKHPSAAPRCPTRLHMHRPGIESVPSFWGAGVAVCWKPSHFNLRHRASFTV